MENIDYQDIQNKQEETIDQLIQIIDLYQSQEKSFIQSPFKSKLIKQKKESFVSDQQQLESSPQQTYCKLTCSQVSQLDKYSLNTYFHKFNFFRFREEGLISGQQDNFQKIIYEDNNDAQNANISDYSQPRLNYPQSAQHSMQTEPLCQLANKQQFLENAREIQFNNDSTKSTSNNGKSQPTESMETENFLSEEMEIEENQSNSHFNRDTHLLTNQVCNSSSQQSNQKENDNLFPITQEQINQIGNKIQSAYQLTLEDIFQQNTSNQQEFKIQHDKFFSFLRVLQMFTMSEISKRILSHSKQEKQGDESKLQQLVQEQFQRLNHLPQYKDLFIYIRTEISLFYALQTSKFIKLNNNLNSKFKKSKHSQDQNIDENLNQKSDLSFYSGSCICGVVYLSRSSLFAHVKKKHNLNPQLCALHIAIDEGRKSGFQNSFNPLQRDIQVCIQEQNYITFRQKLREFHQKECQNQSMMA